MSTYWLHSVWVLGFFLSLFSFQGYALVEGEIPASGASVCDNFLGPWLSGTEASSDAAYTTETPVLYDLVEIYQCRQKMES